MPKGVYKKSKEHCRNLSQAIKKAHIGRPLFGKRIKEVCFVTECKNKHYGLGYCRKHYARFKKYANPFEVHKSSGNQIRGKLNPNWKGGIAKYPNHVFMKKQRLIILMQTPKCEKCGKLATEIHHKDKNKANHKLSNLMAVCHKCNMSFHLDVIGRPRKNKKNN